MVSSLFPLSRSCLDFHLYRSRCLSEVLALLLDNWMNRIEINPDVSKCDWSRFHRSRWMNHYTIEELINASTASLPDEEHFCQSRNTSIHSYEILTIEQGEPCYLSIWSNACTFHKECQANLSKPRWCLWRISNGTNSLKPALLYRRNFERV